MSDDRRILERELERLERERWPNWLDVLRELYGSLVKRQPKQEDPDE